MYQFFGAATAEEGIYSQQETKLLYTLSDERLSEGSIVITSNRPPED